MCARARTYTYIILYIYIILINYFTIKRSHLVLNLFADMEPGSLHVGTWAQRLRNNILLIITHHTYFTISEIIVNLRFYKLLKAILMINTKMNES